MRIVNTFVYNGGKSFLAWELTVGQYLMFLRDTEYAIHFSLTEYNKEKPQLNTYQLNAFLDILLWAKPIDRIAKQKKNIEHVEKDFHLQYVAVCRVTNSDCRDMPLVIFNRILEDMDIIQDPSKYKADRHIKTPDKQAFKKVTGQWVLQNNQKK